MKNNEMIRYDDKKYSFYQVKNKFNYEVWMGSIEVNGEKYIPDFCLNSFVFNPNLNWKKRLEKTKEMINFSIDEETKQEDYGDLFSSTDLITLSHKDENVKELYNTVLEMEREHYFKMFGVEKSKRGMKPKYILMSEEALRYIVTQFQFYWDDNERKSNDKKDKMDLLDLIRDKLHDENEYIVKDYQRLIFFTNWEDVIKQLFNKEINFFEWSYLKARQVGKFIELREFYAELLASKYTEYYNEDENFKFKCRFKSDNWVTRQQAFKHLVYFHIEQTYGNKNKLSYKAIPYSSLSAMEKEISKFKNEEINVKEFILNIISIYREVINITKYGMEKVFEQVLVNNETTETLKDKSQAKTIRKTMLELDNKNYIHNSLRYKYFNMVKVNTEFMNNYLPLMNENNEFVTVLNNSIITKYMDLVSEYGDINRQINFMEAFMDSGFISDFKNDCKLLYYNKNEKLHELVNGLTFNQHKELYIEYPELDIFCGHPMFNAEIYDDKVDRLAEIYNTVDNWVENNKKQLSKLKIRKYEIENSLQVNREYLTDYLKNDITVKQGQYAIADLSNLFDDEYYVVDETEMKKVNLPKRHTNQLLED